MYVYVYRLLTFNSSNISPFVRADPHTLFPHMPKQTGLVIDPLFTLSAFSWKKSWMNYVTIDSCAKKYDSSKLTIFISEKFKKLFYFFTCILPDYVAHDITKDFFLNSHFENMTAGFLLRCQNLLRYFTPEMMHEKNYFNQ